MSQAFRLICSKHSWTKKTSQLVIFESLMIFFTFPRSLIRPLSILSMPLSPLSLSLSLSLPLSLSIYLYLSESQFVFLSTFVFVSLNIFLILWGIEFILIIQGSRMEMWKIPHSFHFVCSFKNQTMIAINFGLLGLVKKMICPKNWEITISLIIILSIILKGI